MCGPREDICVLAICVGECMSECEQTKNTNTTNKDGQRSLKKRDKTRSPAVKWSIDKEELFIYYKGQVEVLSEFTGSKVRSQEGAK